VSACACVCPKQALKPRNAADQTLHDKLIVNKSADGHCQQLFEHDVKVIVLSKVLNTA